MGGTTGKRTVRTTKLNDPASEKLVGKRRAGGVVTSLDGTLVVPKAGPGGKGPAIEKKGPAIEKKGPAIEKTPVGKKGPGIRKDPAIKVRPDGKTRPQPGLGPLPPIAGPHISKINGRDVIEVPGLVGMVPLIVEAREVLHIEGQCFSASDRAWVVDDRAPYGFAVDVPGEAGPGGTRPPDRMLDQTRGLGTDSEIYVSAPTVAQLQLWTGTIELPSIFASLQQKLGFAYQRNSVLLPLVVRIYNPSSTQPWSPPVILGVLLPPPKIGKVKVENGWVRIGTCVDPNDNGTVNLGRKENGSVSWFSSEQWLARIAGTDLAWAADLSQLRFSIDGQLIRQIGADPVAVLTKGATGIWDALAQLRSASTITPQPLWADTSVQFQLPAGSFGLNYMVLWRDDIPSAPIPIWSWHYTCAELASVSTKIQNALDALWTVHHSSDGGVASSDQTVDIPPLAPGEWAPLVVEYAGEAASNLLSQLLKDRPSGFGLRLWTQLSQVNEDGTEEPLPYDRSTVEPPLPKSKGEADDQLRTSQLPHLSNLADLYRTTNKYLFRPLLAPGPDVIAVRLKLDVTLPGSAGCQPATFQIGPTFRVQQQPFDIPTFAVFFTGETCGMRPLLVLPESQRLLNLHTNNADHWGFRWDITGAWDGNTSLLGAADSQNPEDLARRRLQAMRNKLVSKLTSAGRAMDALKLFGMWPHDLDPIYEAVTRIACTAELGIDTTGAPRLDLLVYTFTGLGYARYWQGHIEYVVLVGPPGSKYHFNCYAPNGITMSLSMPDDNWVAGMKMEGCIPWLGLERPAGAPPPGVNWSEQVVGMTVTES